MPSSLSLALADQHNGRGAVADRRAHRPGQRLGDHRRRQNVLDAELLTKLRAGVEAPVKGVLRRHTGQLLDGRAVAIHVGPSRLRVDVHEHGTLLAGARAGARGPGLLGPLLQIGENLLHRLDVHGSSEGREALALVHVVQLLDTDRQNHIVEAGRDHRRGLVHRRRRAGARVLDVDHRQLSQSQRAQHHLTAYRLLAGDQTGGGVAYPGRLQVSQLHAGVLHSLLDRSGPDGLQPLVQILSEAGHPHSGNRRVQTHISSPRRMVSGRQHTALCRAADMIADMRATSRSVAVED